MATILHRLALSELQKSFRWYRKRNPSAAQRFWDAMRAAVERIAEGPGRWPIVDQYPEYRWLKLQRFPYLLYYQILNSADVLIVAVAHGRRRLGYWRRRRLGS